MINFNMPYIWQTMPDSLTITPRKCAVSKWLEKFQSDQIQNGRLLVIINYNMPDIWQQTEADSYPDQLFKKNVRFLGGI